MITVDGVSYKNEHEFYSAMSRRRFPTTTDEQGLTEFYETELMQICSDRQIESETLVYGYKRTPDQLARYADKYARAKAGEFSKAQNSIVIKKHEEAQAKMRGYVDLIEMFREQFADAIKAKQFDKCDKLYLWALDNFTAQTTKPEILNWFKNTA